MRFTRLKGSSKRRGPGSENGPKLTGFQIPEKKLVLGSFLIKNAIFTPLLKIF